jgi:AcrR family transcriptional regulator
VSAAASATAAAPAAQERPAEATRVRIMDAALRVSEESGLRRTTMDDVARKAGLARITLYRHFENKDALVQAVVLRETERFFAALDSATSSCRRAEERVVEGFATAIAFLEEHTLLQRLLRTEPEAILPYLTGATPVVAAARNAVAERLSDEALIDPLPRARADEAAEVFVRLAHSLLLSPDDALGLATREGARRFARRYLATALVRPVETPRD